MTEWKAGMKVILAVGRNEYIKTISRVTPKGMAVITNKNAMGNEYSTHFNPDGSERNSDIWRRGHIEEASEEDVIRVNAKNRLATAKNKARNINFDVLTIEQLEKILEIAK